MDPKRTGRFIQAVDFPARKPKPVMQNFLAVHEMSAEIPIWKCFKRRHFRRKFFKRFVGPIINPGAWFISSPWKRARCARYASIRSNRQRFTNRNDFKRSWNSIPSVYLPGFPGFLHLPHGRYPQGSSTLRL